MIDLPRFSEIYVNKIPTPAAVAQRTARVDKPRSLARSINVFSFDHAVLWRNHSADRFRLRVASQNEECNNQGG